MIKVGITGGIGSGKSVVSELLRLSGVPVYIADQESKRLTNTSPCIREQLIALFGKDIYSEDGLNKKRLASHIFGNPDYLQQVNAIIHPEVTQDFLSWAAGLSAKICAVESAILFESGFNRNVDVSLMVYAPLDIRIERVLVRDNITREEVVRRISNQMSDEYKRTLSDYVIYNDNSRALLPQVRDFLASL